MAQALSDDLRLRALKASAAGMSARQAAARFGVGISTAIRWIARAKEGEPTPRPQGWRRPSVLDAHEAFVVGLIEDRKDVTLDEMVELLSVERLVRSAGVHLGLGCERVDGRLKNVWPAPLVRRLLMAFFGRAQTCPA